MQFSGTPATIAPRPRWHENVAAFWPRNLIAFVGSRIQPKADNDYLAQTEWLRQRMRVDEPIIRRRAQRIDPELLELMVRSPGVINASLVALSLKWPTILSHRIQWDFDAVTRPFAKEVLAQIHALCEELDAELRLVIIPSWEIDLRNWPTLRRMGYIPDEKLVHDRRFQNTHKHFAKELGIPVLDLTEVFAGSSERCYFELDPHLNPTGHGKIAPLLARWLDGSAASPADSVAPEESYVPVRSWGFTQPGQAIDWTAASGTSTRIEEGRLVVVSSQSAPTILRLWKRFDTAEFNRLRIRFRCWRGTHGLFRWGKLQRGKPVEAAFTSRSRQGCFPVLSDGQFHTYEVALDHVPPEWKDRQWTVMELTLGALHSSQETAGEIVVEIEYIEFGRAEPSIVPPNVWASVEAAMRETGEPSAQGGNI